MESISLSVAPDFRLASNAAWDGRLDESAWGRRMVEQFGFMSLILQTDDSASTKLLIQTSAEANETK